VANVLVAGAGVAGLAAAIELSRCGHMVTVLDKSAQNDLAYPWKDCICREQTERLTGKTLDQAFVHKYENTFYCSPFGGTRLLSDRSQVSFFLFDRRELHRMLLECAEENGVSFCFEAAVTEPIFTANRVIGVRTQGKSWLADLVVDALGVNSPLRRRLPKLFGIERDYGEDDVFYAYRAYFRKRKNVSQPEVPFATYLLHNGEKGLSWVNTEEELVDVLVGRTEPMTPAKLRRALDSLMRSNPIIGDDVIADGFGVIPIRRPLKKFVCDGYAAIGDSAYMTYPFSGSGIDLSMDAAHILGECVKNSAAFGEMISEQCLLNYQNTYLSVYGASLTADDLLKRQMLRTNPRALEHFFRCGLITQAAFEGGSQATTPSQILKSLMYPLSLAHLGLAGAKGNRLKRNAQ